MGEAPGRGRPSMNDHRVGRRGKGGGDRPACTAMIRLVRTAVPRPSTPKSLDLMTDRAACIERIRQLLEDRRHPEPRVGIFSATSRARGSAANDIFAVRRSAYVAP